MGKKDNGNKGSDTVIYGVDKHGFASVCYKKTREGVDATCTRHVVGHTSSLSSSNELAAKYLKTEAGSKFLDGSLAVDGEFVDDPDDDIISVNEYGQASEGFTHMGGSPSSAVHVLSGLSEQDVLIRETGDAFNQAKLRFGENHPVTQKLLEEWRRAHDTPFKKFMRRFKK